MNTTQETTVPETLSRNADVNLEEMTKYILGLSPEQGATIELLSSAMIHAEYVTIDTLRDLKVAATAYRKIKGLNE
jgi:hypothetical protein